MYIRCGELQELVGQRVFQTTRWARALLCTLRMAVCPTAMSTGYNHSHHLRFRTVTRWHYYSQRHRLRLLPLLRCRSRSLPALTVQLATGRIPSTLRNTRTRGFDRPTSTRLSSICCCCCHPAAAAATGLPAAAAATVCCTQLIFFFCVVLNFAQLFVLSIFFAQPISSVPCSIVAARVHFFHFSIFRSPVCFSGRRASTYCLRAILHDPCPVFCSA